VRRVELVLRRVEPVAIGTAGKLSTQRALSTIRLRINAFSDLIIGEVRPVALEIFSIHREQRSSSL